MCYQALMEVPRLFQMFAWKQVMAIAGTNEMQAHYTLGHAKKCPKCGVVIEMCGHILSCEEAGWVEVLNTLINFLD